MKELLSDMKNIIIRQHHLLCALDYSQVYDIKAMSTDWDFSSNFSSFVDKCNLLKEKLQTRCDGIVKTFRIDLDKEAAAFEETVSMYAALNAAHMESCENVKKANERINVLQNETDELLLKKSDAEQLHALLEDQVKQAKVLLEQQTQENEQLLATNEAKRRKLQYSAADCPLAKDLAKQYLGLEIRTLRDSRVQILFYGLFPDTPDVTLFVIVRLVDKVYEVLDSEPALDSLKQLEIQLNNTNNFSGFVQLIREQLKSKYLLENS